MNMKNTWIIGLLTIGATVLGIACGAAAVENDLEHTALSDETIVTPTATAAPVATVTDDASSDSPSSGSTPTTDLDDMGVDPFELGERIFLSEAAKGVGCQLCHGPEGKGDIGPNIRGQNALQVEIALNTVEDMGFIRLDAEERAAVATYLAWLATQP